MTVTHLAPTDSIIWERWPGESRQAFHAFQHYRNMGNGTRTLLQAYITHQTRCLGHTGRWNGANGRWSTWASAWQWVKRCAEWDAHEDRLRQSEIEEAARQRSMTMQAERTQITSMERTMADQLIEKAKAMLNLPVTAVVQETDQIEAYDAQGRRITVPRTITRIEPARWTWRDVGDMVQVASKLRRLAAGMETDARVVRLDVEDEIRKMARENGWDEEETVRSAVELARKYA